MTSANGSNRVTQLSCVHPCGAVGRGEVGIVLGFCTSDPARPLLTLTSAVEQMTAMPMPNFIMKLHIESLSHTGWEERVGFRAD